MPPRQHERYNTSIVGAFLMEESNEAFRERRRRALCFRLLIRGIAAPPVWKECAPGVWKATAGTPEDYDLLKSRRAPHHSPKPSIICPRFRSPSTHPPSTRTQRRQSHRPLLPARRRRRHLRPRRRLHGHAPHRHDVPTPRRPLEGHPRSHPRAPDPFFTSPPKATASSLTDRPLPQRQRRPRRACIDDKTKPPAIDRNTGKSWAANPRAESIQAAFNGPGADIYLFAGPSPMDVVRRFNLLCGGGALPPMWGLGFLTRTPSLYNR